MKNVRKEKKKEGKYLSKKASFSKMMLVQESALIWLVTISCLLMAFVCIFTGSFVELPWITAMVGCPWAAYAITQNAYYKKAMQENTKGGIVYDSAFGVGSVQTDDYATETPVG